MFADAIADPSTTEGLSVPWWAWVAIAVVVVGATWWVISRLRGSNLAGGFHATRDFVAGHVRRLLMKRTAASPAPPTVHAPEAPAASPAPTGEAPPPPKAAQSAAKEEASRPPVAPAEEAPAWITKALVVIASVPTLLALPWAAWSVAQLLPVPLQVALPLGILFDVAMVGAVLVALLVPSVSRQASLLGWVASGAAAAAIAVHVGWSGALIFASTPLISKALWGLLITIRRQQASLRASRMEAERRRREAREERKAELSTDLTFEQQEEIARLEREALYEEKLAAAKLKVKLAKSEAEHLEALAEIARLGAEQRAMDEESANVEIARQALVRKVNASRPASFLLPTSEVAEAELVPEITANAGGTKAGFGGGFGFQRPLDVKALTPEGAKVSFQELPETHQALVKYVHGEKAATIRGASRKLDRDPRTIRRWKEDLAELGYDLPIGK